MASITIDAAANSLNLHQRVYDKKINQVLRLGMETESKMSQVRTMHTHVAPNAEVQDIIQAYQCDFTPNLSVDFNAVENTLQRIKIDIQFECEDLDQFYDSWMAEWVEDGKERDQWSFPHFVYQEIVMPKVTENMETISFKGQYVAPTAGTPGVTINAVDGLRIKLANAVTAGDLTPIPTGALVESTMVDQMETFCDALPLSYRNLSGDIHMSHTNARKFLRDYRTQFGTGNGILGNENSGLRIDATNKRIVGLASMEGTDAILFTPKRNLVVGRRIGEPVLPKIRWQVFERKLKGLAEFSRFYGVKFYGNTFINDQF